MIDTALPRTLEETLDALDAKLENDNDTEGQRALMRHAREQIRAQDDRIESLEHERDTAESDKDWAEQNLVDPDSLYEDRARIVAQAIDALLDHKRGLFTLDEAIERMHRLEDQ